MGPEDRTDKKLRVLQLNKYYAPVIGGVEKVAEEIGRGLSERTEMTVLVCNRQGPAAEEERDGVRVVRAASPRSVLGMPLSFSYFIRLRRLAREADVLLLHEPFPLGDVAVLLRAGKKPLAVWWHSDIVRQKRWRFLYGPLQRKILNRASVILAATQAHVDFSEALEEFRGKCRIIPFGIDAAAFRAGAASCSPLQELKDPSLLSAPASASPLKLLFVGRLVPYKGVEILLRALALTEEIDLYIVGKGPLGESLRGLAVSLGIEERVHFLGEPEDPVLKACYRDCGAFVLPSVTKNEAFGLVQMEAMAFGKPVVNTALPSGVPWVSLHGQSGMTVPPGDVDALAGALEALKDGELRERLGRGALERVETEFSMGIMLERVLAALEEAAGSLKD
ncbi:MAG: glycosyltransferase [Bacillota bacterium]|nr:glycosyltransferase [Bacillota bacterium]